MQQLTIFDFLSPDPEELLEILAGQAERPQDMKA